MTQQDDPLYQRMERSMKGINAVFSLPEGFRSLDGGRRFPCGDWKHTNAMFYTITNKDSSVRIGFSVIPPMTTRTNERIKSRNPGYDPNDNGLNSAKSRADTINNRLVLYRVDYLKRFNADKGGEYVRNCTLPYEDSYPWHKVVFISKDGRGHIEITYFYTDGMVGEMDSIIRETAGLIRYND